MLTDLADCLARQLEAGERLLEAIRAEAEALRRGTPEDIEAATGAKQAALDAFAQLDTERERHLARSGWEATTGERPAAWLHRQRGPGRDAALTRWEQLLRLGAECSRDNLVNAALIQAGIRQGRELLELLHGGSPADAPAYGPVPPAPRLGHSLGKA